MSNGTTSASHMQNSPIWSPSVDTSCTSPIWSLCADTASTFPSRAPLLTQLVLPPIWNPSVDATLVWGSRWGGGGVVCLWCMHAVIFCDTNVTMFVAWFSQADNKQYLEVKGLCPFHYQITEWAEHLNVWRVTQYTTSYMCLLFQRLLTMPMWWIYTMRTTHIGLYRAKQITQLGILVGTVNSWLTL